VTPASEPKRASLSIIDEPGGEAVIGFILDPKGLMYNLTLEGSKIS